MPKKSKSYSRKYNKKRSYRRKRRKFFKKRKPISRQLGLGTSHTARLRYCAEINLNPVSGGMASHVFRANDLFDPDVTSVGHQPYGFDQLMALFNHFTVIGSTCKVQQYNSSTTSVNPAWLGIMLTDDGTRVSTSVDVNHLLESYGAGNVIGVGWVGAPNGSSIENKVFKSFSAKKFFKKNAIIGSADYRGDSSASPNEAAYYEVYCAAIGSNDPGLIQLLVTIEYIAVFTEPKRVVQS